MFELTRDVKQLEAIANELRVDIVRMLAEAGSGHPGGSLSAIDIITTLYFGWMRHDPANPAREDRDRFVISKGHGVPALYAVMARTGYLPHDELLTLRKLGSRLQGHPDAARLPGIEASTGALGQGLSVAQGMAMASKLDGDKFRVYSMIGDGESQEGQIWEAAMSAAKFELDNLCVFLDHNGGQIDGYTKDVMSLEPVEDKWRAFNWNVLRINGHDIEQVFHALEEAQAAKGKPTMIVADTVKGKGVSFMENDVGWHGVAPTADEAAKAIAELEGR